MTLERRDLVELLPEVMRLADLPGSPFAATLDAMHDLLAPTMARIETVDMWFDPLTAPPAALPLLATWLDLAVAAEVTVACHDDEAARDRALRRLVIAGHDLVRLRGTRQGLERLLRIVTSMDHFTLDDGAATAPFHLAVVAPQAVADRAGALRRLIEHERPVYVTWSLRFEPLVEP